jgi:hypothetical protein
MEIIDMNQPHCYAIRLVNPFTGILQVVSHGIARGLSRDGFNWEIQVQVERNTGGWGSLNRNQKELKFYRYGFWNPRDGVMRLPTDPSVDVAQLKEGYKLLLHQLRSGVLEQLPFTIEDSYEYWLLDKNHMPLALLGSTCDKNMLPRIREQKWHAVSTSLRVEMYPQTSAESLESLIRLNSVKRQWFHRSTDGSAVSLDYRASASLAGRELTAADFPELLVQEEWDDPQERKLVAKWASYLAPWLLQLQNISEPRRAFLERDASRNPEMLEILHRLYPQVIDQLLINTARVSAKIQTASK